MSELRDLFIKQVDSSKDGIIGHIGKFSDLFKASDPELWTSLVSNKSSRGHLLLYHHTTLSMTTTTKSV